MRGVITQRASAAIDMRRRALAVSLAALASLSRAAGPSVRVPILTFHRFAAEARDSMTLRIAEFDAQLRLLQSLDCRVIPLGDWVAWRHARARGEPATLPRRAVVLTADDGHRSQFEVMAPRLRELGWPVTLFIYPSAISNADYAMTWDQLQHLAASPQVSVQSHTYWHPNLLREREHKPPADFKRFAADQLVRSRNALAQRLGRPVTLLAWPFGLSDAGLAGLAREAGYEAAFSLGNRSAGEDDPLYAVPRHLIAEGVGLRALGSRLAAAFGPEEQW
jgi:peptidoglycan/xylan/chitin deacetylase (PgdA/CDA1 family)